MDCVIPIVKLNLKLECQSLVYAIIGMHIYLRSNKQDSVYNLIKCSGNYSKIPESLWQYYRDETPLDNMVVLLIFLVNPRQE